MEKKWFVFYTKSRQEKTVNQLLLRRGYEPFLPLQVVMRQWSDRKKKVVVPLFNSYIFVFLYEHEVQNVLQLPGIAWNIRHDGKPAVLHNAELATIKRFIETGWLIESSVMDEKYDLGEQVKIIDGPLKGLVGRLIRFTNKHRFGILLESIGQVITVEVDKNALRKLTDKEIDKVSNLL